MNSHIAQHILSLFDKDATGKMAGKLGEDQTQVRSALELIVPAVLKGFASKSAEGGQAVSHLYQLAQEATSSNWFRQAAHWFTGDDLFFKGEEIANDIFGNKNTDRIAGQVAAHSGVTPSSAFTLIKWAAPVCLGALGQYAADHTLDASAMGSWLNSQRDSFSQARTTAAATAAASSSIAYDPQQEHKRKQSKLWIPFLLLLATAGIIFFFVRGCDNAPAETSAADTTHTLPDISSSDAKATVTAPSFRMLADSTVSYQYGDTITERLPNDVVLRIPDNSAEALLITKIKQSMAHGLDTTEAGKKEGWINLYDVQFTKMLTYREGAEGQIKNIAKILSAFPSVHLKIGGYTDNTGSAEINRKVSRERADKVAHDLGAAGVSAQITGAEGYGPEFPVADNATAEGRAQNRRVSCRIARIGQ